MIHGSVVSGGAAVDGGTSSVAHIALRECRERKSYHQYDCSSRPHAIYSTPDSILLVRMLGLANREPIHSKASCLDALIPVRLMEPAA